MSKKYTQISLMQRYQIEAFLKAGMKQKMIALEIRVYPSMISRECGRNITKRASTSGVYIGTNAQRKTELRDQQKPKMVKFIQPMKEQAV